VITLLFVGWYAEIAFKAIAAYRLYHTRLLREYPVLFIFLLMSVVKSSVLVQLRHAPEAYATLYSVSVPMMLILQFLCGIELFQRLTSNYPNFARAGKIFLTFFAIMGVTASTATRHIGVPATWYGMREAAVLLDRYALLALFVGLVLMALFVPLVQSLPIPRNARRAAMIMSFYVFGNSISAMMLVGTSAAWRLVPAYVTITTGLLAALGWLTLPTAGSEAASSCTDPPAARRSLREYLRFIGTLRAQAAP